MHGKKAGIENIQRAIDISGLISINPTSLILGLYQNTLDIYINKTNFKTKMCMETIKSNMQKSKASAV